MQMVIALLSVSWMLPGNSAKEMAARIGTYVHEICAPSDPNARLEQILLAGEELRRSERKIRAIKGLSTPSIVQRFDPQPFEAGDPVIEFPKIEHIVTTMFVAAVSPALPSRVICKRVDEVLASLEDCACRLICGDPNVRMEQLLNTLEDLRQIENEWRKFWYADQVKAEKPRESTLR